MASNMPEEIVFSVDENKKFAIQSDEEMLSKYCALIDEIMCTGHAYEADGAFTYTQSSLPQLEKLRDKYERRVLLNRGVTGRNIIS
jgi:hypothetical protein